MWVSGEGMEVAGGENQRKNMQMDSYVSFIRGQIDHDPSSTYTVNRILGPLILLS